MREEDLKEAMEKDGVLTGEEASGSLLHLGRCGTGQSHVLHHLSLCGRDLRDVSALCNYVHIQKLELRRNKIKDLSCVSHMPFLVILDASHNEISDFFGFQPSRNLKVVDLSHNFLTEMKDLSAFTCLSKVDLDHNGLAEISGLEKCRKLTHLSLAHNKITRIGGLGTLPLVHLSLRSNQIESMDGLEGLRNLRVLDLALNRISSLNGLHNLHLLGTINMEKNLIKEIQECRHIHDLLLLRELNLLGNPVQEQPDFRLSAIFLLQHLTVLDQETVTVEEKVTAINRYDPPLDVVASRDHMTHLVYQLMRPQVLYDSTLPGADSPYPMLVLTGPRGCGKRELAHRLCQEFSEYFAYGTCHTTRGPYFGEENGSDYHFVSEEDFQDIIHKGKFIQTVQYGGHRYGLSRDAVEEAAKEGLACCVHMELEGVLSLKKSCFEPRYILLVPTQVEMYKGRLGSRGFYTCAQIDAAVSRIQLYAGFNRQRPGFFDNVVPCDDLEDAYQMLGQVVKDYLLLEEQEEGEGRSGDQASTAWAQGPEEKPPTDPSRSGSASASRSDSSLDPSNPFYRNYSIRVRERLGSRQSPAELDSIRRREQPMREAIAGRNPGVYGQIIRSSAEGVSSPRRDPDRDPGGSARSEESRQSSAPSAPSSAGAPSAPDSSDPDHGADAFRDSVTSYHSDTACLDSAGATPSSERRPGSDARPVLPPIPTGRKTPAGLGPAPSPGPRPAAEEERADERAAA